MDRMDIVGKDGSPRYRVEADRVSQLGECRHVMNDSTARCKFCGKSKLEIEQTHPAHNQF